jgi:hypothetical protein
LRLPAAIVAESLRGAFDENLTSYKQRSKFITPACPWSICCRGAIKTGKARASKSGIMLQPSCRRDVVL